ncbi:type II toxin-antitoxin system HicB family antitoxin [uncultured Dialister sp.]|jgi:predicted RNase H-like HicB family nuclease|uniref:type II toxin-antitoxin system HicB family antitoxin n=1 Tax=uncultured Dialister sp. TaxID=278064 RepID=UPI0025CE1F49|nr:type II toxin-antitoxin system HicB family antitoxin [uncultured Dialister sp.]
MMTYFYPAVFEHDTDKGMFTAVFPDLPGCQASGRSMDETTKKARDAMAASLLEMEEKEISIPLPSDERLLQRRLRHAKVCVMLVDMNSYRAFRAYKVKNAETKSAEWAASARKGRKAGILARVFGLR